MDAISGGRWVRWRRADGELLAGGDVGKGSEPFPRSTHAYFTLPGDACAHQRVRWLVIWLDIQDSSEVPCDPIMVVYEVSHDDEGLVNGHADVYSVHGIGALSAAGPYA